MFEKYSGEITPDMMKFLVRLAEAKDLVAWGFVPTYMKRDDYMLANWSDLMEGIAVDYYTQIQRPLIDLGLIQVQQYGRHANVIRITKKGYETAVAPIIARMLEEGYTIGCTTDIWNS